MWAFFRSDLHDCSVSVWCLERVLRVAEHDLDACAEIKSEKRPFLSNMKFSLEHPLFCRTVISWEISPRVLLGGPVQDEAPERKVKCVKEATFWSRCFTFSTFLDVKMMMRKRKWSLGQIFCLSFISFVHRGSRKCTIFLTSRQQLIKWRSEFLRLF